MTAHFFRLIGASVACASLLAACGGGGGGGGGTPAATTPATTPPTTSFALSAGYKAYIASGSDKSFKVVVTTLTAGSTAGSSCNGTARIVTVPATQTTFEGFTAYPLTQDSTLTLMAPCAITASPTHGSTYYNANYVPIGLSITGGDYSKFDSPHPDQLALPASVAINDTATFDTLASYPTSTAGMPTGKRTLSYQITPDPTNTSPAIANIITVFSDVATPANVLSTQTSSYGMAADGTLTLRSIDVQLFSAFADPKQTHLVYTATN